MPSEAKTPEIKKSKSPSDAKTPDIKKSKSPSEAKTSEIKKSESPSSTSFIIPELKKKDTNNKLNSKKVFNNIPSILKPINENDILQSVSIVNTNLTPKKKTEKNQEQGIENSNNSYNVSSIKFKNLKMRKI